MAVSAQGNTFDPTSIAATIGSLFDDAMTIRFGREGWRILDIEVPFFPHQRIGSTRTGLAERYTPDERRAFAQRVIDWGLEMGAYEVTVRQYPSAKREAVNEPGEDPYWVRLFWE